MTSLEHFQELQKFLAEWMEEVQKDKLPNSFIPRAVAGALGFPPDALHRERDLAPWSPVWAEPIRSVQSQEQLTEFLFGNPFKALVPQQPRNTKALAFIEGDLRREMGQLVVRMIRSLCGELLKLQLQLKQINLPLSVKPFLRAAIPGDAVMSDAEVRSRLFHLLPVDYVSNDDGLSFEVESFSFDDESEK